MRDSLSERNLLAHRKREPQQSDHHFAMAPLSRILIEVTRPVASKAITSPNTLYQYGAQSRTSTSAVTELYCIVARAGVCAREAYSETCYCTKRHSCHQEGGPMEKDRRHQTDASTTMQSAIIVPPQTGNKMYVQEH
jgi:hypothetical protein